MAKLLKRVKKEGNPLIDGNEVTFVWEGKKAPELHLENSNFETITMQKAGKKLWTHQETVPSDAYLEYAFTKKKNSKHVPDPYNPNSVDTGVGSDNHYFSMPERVHTGLIEKRSGIERGKVSKHRIAKNYWFFKKRKLWLYEPVTKDPVPLLVVLDGKDYKQRGYIVNIVDNLIADGRIQPIALAMIDNAKYRMTEYNQGDSIPVILTSFVLPYVTNKLNLLDITENPGTYGILGASMGGLMALYTGLRLPDIFGKVISQSGTFMSLDGERAPLIQLLVDMLPATESKIWLDCGNYEFLIEANRDMQQRLSEKGYDVCYREHNSGHNYTAWRDMLPEALETMFGV